MKVGDLVKVHLLNDLDWYPAIGIFTGYCGVNNSLSYVFVDSKKLRFLSMDVKAVK
tara:strand:+ start:818 stop:985 length:168 start_codon:yes stop_codon:yes gene_type:complete